MGNVNVNHKSAFLSTDATSEETAMPNQPTETPPPPQSQPSTLDSDIAGLIQHSEGALSIEASEGAAKSVNEEPIMGDSGPSAEQIKDANAEGGVAGLAAKAAGIPIPEQLTEEDCTDVVIAIYEVETLGLSAIGYEFSELETSRAQRAGRALARILKRHPDWIKGVTADLLDAAIIGSILGGPVIMIAGQKAKEWFAKRKAEKEKKDEKETAKANSPPKPTVNEPPKVEEPPVVDFRPETVPDGYDEMGRPL